MYIRGLILIPELAEGYEISPSTQAGLVTACIAYHEIISAVILFLRRIKKGFVSYKRKYMHKVLVNRLVKLAQEKKVWLGELTVPT